MPKQIHEILEQHAIFDGKPRFMCSSAVINLLNHYSYGDIQDAVDDGCENPRKYKVRIIIETEEISLPHNGEIVPLM